MEKFSAKTNPKSSFFFLNKSLIRHYTLFKTWQAGLVLKAIDVKMILNNHFDISSSFVYIDKQNEVFLKAVKVKKVVETASLTASKSYKLLLNKQEILQLKGKKQQSKLTIIPTKIFFSNHKLKLEIALAKKLKKYNKKEKLIARDLEKKKKQDWYS